MRPTKEQVRKMIGYGWDEEDAERGYVLADERIFDGNGNEQTVECVERIDEGGAYEGDVEASLQAAQDGVRMLFQDGDAMSQLPLRLDLYDGQLYLSLVNLNTGGEVLALTITDTAANRKALGILGASDYEISLQTLLEFVDRYDYKCSDDDERALGDAKGVLMRAVRIAERRELE